MKRVFKSAFALSLILILSPLLAQTEGIDDFLGLESEVLPEVAAPLHFPKKDLHQKTEWNVTEKQVVIDKEPLKGQGHSIIPWKTLDTVKFLDINEWVTEREIKDKTPDWQIRLRDARHAELIGKILKCAGVCQVHRGIKSVKGQHLTRLEEGDEISTDKTSTAWIYLMDGTLVRLASNSSLSLLEINISGGMILHVARLNHGHVFWHPRQKAELVADYAPETDVEGLPLLIREANQEFFERKIFASQKDPEHLFEVINLAAGAIKEQFEQLNLLKGKNNPSMTYKHKIMLVAPNATIVSTDQSFDLVHIFGGKSFFKKRGVSEGEAFSLHLRGYTQTETQVPSTEGWHEVEQSGRSYALLENVPPELQISELLTKRIKTMELARELWLEKYSLPMLASLSDNKKLAVDHGYRLWGEELIKRFDYLVEYTRRIETTNLRAQENLFARLEASGEKPQANLDDSHYQTSLNRYLKSLKTRYTEKKMQVREMSDLQYYVWILKNGKL